MLNALATLPLVGLGHFWPKIATVNAMVSDKVNYRGTQS